MGRRTNFDDTHSDGASKSFTEDLIHKPSEGKVGPRAAQSAAVGIV
jgi:hypothetical protein